MEALARRRAKIEPGDMVRVNDGIPYHALVREIDGPRLIVRPMIEGQRRLAPKHVKRGWVDRHWKLVYDLVGDRYS